MIFTMENIHTTKTQNFFRILLGLFMITAAFGHLTFQRIDFQAQVPNWVPMDKDLVVILSGIVELILGLALIFLTKYKVHMGIFLAVFYVMVFPGNIAQYLNRIDALGMNTDQARLIRLFFQPVLIFLALWSTGAIEYLRKKK
ncbi:membrane protein [Flavobacterium sp. GSB-24]|nr:membrane protein [Flavobacterium sp. GSB-24]